MTKLENFIIQCHENPTWPLKFEKKHGLGAAYSFNAGIFELYSEVDEALNALLDKKGSLLKDTDAELRNILPQCFSSRYNQDFVTKFFERVGWWLENGDKLEYGCAHTVIDEIILRIAQNIGACFMELEFPRFPGLKEYVCPPYDRKNNEYPGGVDILEYGNWAYDLLGDSDIDFLWEDEEYTEHPMIAEGGSSYHFDHWFEPQFYLHRD